jgi:hypothetical protein
VINAINVEVIRNFLFVREIFESGTWLCKSQVKEPVDLNVEALEEEGLELRAPVSSLLVTISQIKLGEF